MKESGNRTEHGYSSARFMAYTSDAVTHASIGVSSEITNPYAGAPDRVHLADLEVPHMLAEAYAPTDVADLMPFRAYAPDAYAAIAAAFRKPNTAAYEMIEKVHIALGDSMLFGAFIDEKQETSLYKKTPYGEEGVWLGIREHGQWVQGSRLYSAAHAGDREDFRDMAFQPSLLLPATDVHGHEATQEWRDGKETGDWRIGLLVSRASLDNLYVVDSDFAARCFSSSAGDTGTFDPFRYVGPMPRHT